MQGIHDALSEAKQRCEELTQQIQALKTARELHGAAAAALEESARNLASASAAILPYTKAKIRRTVVLVVVATLLNTAMFAVVLATVLVKN